MRLGHQRLLFRRAGVFRRQDGVRLIPCFAEHETLCRLVMGMPLDACFAMTVGYLALGGLRRDQERRRSARDPHQHRGSAMVRFLRSATTRFPL